MKDFKTFINENLLVPRNLEGRKEKLKQMNMKLLSQEVIDGDLHLDESFMNIDAKFVKLKKVNGGVWLIERKWTEIPEWLKDVEILGSFSCSGNKLTTMKNCPQKIGGSFWCNNNLLSSLEGCAKEISGHFECDNNLLISLKGSPKNVEGYFSCSNNQLSTLEGCVKNVGLDFWCEYNVLSSLEGCPETIKGDFYCKNNKVILELPENVKLKGKFINLKF